MTECDDPLDPGGTEWTRRVSPSKIAALLGISRWDSAYALWHRTKGLIAPEPDKDEFTAGHAFEPALAYLWRHENPGWQLSPGGVRIVRDDLEVPALVTLDRRARRGRARRVVEFKIARSLEEWGDDFTDEGPADYVCQVQMQMYLTGWTDHPAHLMVMGPFFAWHTYEIAYDRALCEEIWQRAVAFWRSLDSDTPPPLDDSKSTYSCIRELHPDIDGSEVQLPPDLAGDYLTAVARDKEITTRLRGLKTRVLHAMGDAETALCGDQKIALRYPHPSGSVALKPNSKTAPAALAELKESA